MTSMLPARLRDAAARFPDRIAHRSAGGAMTYRELWGRAQKLAAHLRTLEAAGPVMVRGHKEPAMLAGFLGAILAGRAYIPVDLSLPEARVERIVATAQPAAVLMVNDVLSLTDGASCDFDAELPSSTNDDPFYVIFTSGSTGDPKGVVITHGCLTAFTEWTLAEHPGLVPGAEVYLNQAPFSFDLSVMDLYTSLLTAGTLVSVTRDELADPRKLYAMLRESGVTMWVSTPAFAQICLVERTFDAAMLPALKRFWFCGETLPHKTAAGLAARFPNTEIWNTYGPTEATVATTSILVNADVLTAHDPLPIGKAMPGTRVLVRREDGTFAADGERGEIIIAGPNVSPGYLARPDLTAQAFSVLDGERCYRTGDRGYASNGLFFFEGRMDFQVKVRGHRIELGDVESHLREVDGVVEAVVLPVERAGIAESLAAFVILRGHTPGTGDFQAGQALRAKAAATLPDYMVPRRIVFVETFPLTPNGKADRKALAAQLAP